MKYGPDNAVFLVGGYNILGYQTEISQKVEALTEESHGLGTSWVENAWVGVRRMELSQNGFYDDAANGNHDALSANLATSKVMVFGVEGNVSGADVVCFSGALQTDYERIAQRGELHKANANYVGAGFVTQGRILHPLTARTASGDTTAAAIDFSASNVSGADAFLQVTAFTAGGSATAAVIDIMHSADNLSFTSWAAFSNTTAAPSAQVKSSTAVIQRYRAVKWNGTASSPAALTFLAALAGK